MRSILWHFPDLPSIEHCILREGADEKNLEGTVLTLVDGLPGEIRYELTCDREWRTRRCFVHIATASGERAIRLVADGQGRWEWDGAALPEVEGVLDVDLGFSPCTNTVAIRRLDLEVGDARRLAVAWLRFPGLDLLRAEQVYTRLAPNVYRYDSGSGDFTATLDIDDHGLVTRYGDFWREVTRYGV
jgi:hypothetical protein